MSTILSNISRSNSFWTICLLEYLDTVWWTPWFDSRRIGLPTTVSELPEKVIKENLSSKTIAITHIHAHKLEKTRTDMALRAKKACGIRDLDMTSMVTFFNDGREFQVSEKNVRVRLASLNTLAVTCYCLLLCRYAWVMRFDLLGVHFLYHFWGESKRESFRARILSLDW